MSVEGGGGRAAVHRAEPGIAGLALEVPVGGVIHNILQVTVRAVAVVLDLLAKAHSLSRLPA